MLKGVLLFVAGLLVGANLVYFLMTRHASTPAAATPAASRTMLPGGMQATEDPASTSAPAIAMPGAAATTPASTGTEVAAPIPTATTSPAAVAPSGVLLPVSGIRPEQLSDTYNDLRGGTRIHEALDIMAARGTPVMAAVDGTVAKLFISDAGGLTVYEFDATSTHAYYYAHLDRYAPGLREGQALRQGEVIGYVGSTGNASPDAPHLHFAIFLLGPEKQWWKGTPVNPYPLLTTP